MEARLDFRTGQLKIAQRELALQEEEVEFSLARVNDSDQHRTNTINGILGKLHQVEKNLGDSCLNNETELKQAQSINRNKQAERNIAFGTVRGELDSELARNAEIEADIKKWAHYQNLASKEDATKIEQLEFELAEHNGNTKAVIDFINRQISNGQKQFDARQAAEADKLRESVFDEAIRCISPSDFYECRESERLKKHCQDHEHHLEVEKEVYQRTIEKLARLKLERDELKNAHLERPRQVQTVLDGGYFR